MCQEPNVLAAGIIMGIYGVKIGLDNSDVDKIIEGKFGHRVSELNEKRNIILIIFSTPQS